MEEEKVIPEVENTDSEMIRRANEAAERLEKANKEARKIAERMESASIQRILGGEMEAGAKTPEPVELTPMEYAKKVQMGEINPFA